MASFLDVCRFTAVSGGTGDFVFAAAVTGYQSPSAAGAVNAAVYHVRAESADLSQWEESEGAYDSGTGTFARTTVLYNSSGSGTGTGQSGAGTKINFSSAPQVAIIAMARDIAGVPASSTDNAAARFDGTSGRLLQNSALIVDDTNGRISRSGNGGIPVQGTNTNDSAAAGDVGEYVSATLASGAANGLATNTPENIASISLTAGDWDVWINGYFTGNVATTVNRGEMSISLTTNTLDTTNGRIFYLVAGGATSFNNNPLTCVVGPVRMSLSGTTTVYFVANLVFGTNTASAYGIIQARRVR